MKLGDIVTFRYDSPKRTFGFNPPRDVMVIAPNYLGHLHGVYITGLTPTQQEYIQRALTVAYTGVGNLLEPMESQIQQRKKELDLLNQQRNDMLRAGQRVVVTPAPPRGIIPQIKDKAKQILGSVIGKISTFGPTPMQTMPSRENHQIQAQIQKHNQTILEKKRELDSFAAQLNKQKAVLNNIRAIPTDPYQFYHQFFKMFIGDNQRMKMIYRKFNVMRIKTPRIVRLAGIIPDATRR